MHASFARPAANATPLHAVTVAGLEAFLAGRDRRDTAFLKNAGFAAKAGELRLVPDAAGAIAFAVLGLGKGGDSLAAAAFSEQLPAGTYVFGDVPEESGGANGALAWALGT